MPLKGNPLGDNGDMPTPPVERETTMTYNEEGGDALIWSASPTFQRKMEKLGIEPYKVGKRDGQPVEESRYYRIPKSFVRIRPPVKRELSQEQRKEMSERARVRFSAFHRQNKASTLAAEGNAAIVEPALGDHP